MSLRRRTCLLAMFVVVSVTTCCGLVADDAAANEDAVKALRKVATNVQFHKDGSVRLVRFSRPHVKDADLQQLTAFPHIDYLAIVHPAITDDGIAPLASLAKLNTIVLTGTAVTDAGLQQLSGLDNLERLYLDDSNITDAGLEHLANLTGLKVLSLRRTAVTDAGIARIAMFTELEALYLCETNVTDVSLERLASLEKLKTLYLAGTKIEGPSLEPLVRLPGLEYLSLSQTKIGDKGLVGLAAAPALKQLVVYDTAVTPDGLTAFENTATRNDLKVHTSVLPSTAAQVAGNSIPDHNTTSDADPAPPTGSATNEVLAGVFNRLADAETVPEFQRHVIPLLGRLGCNGRTCHGSFQGQGGFRLSMFGYDFATDLEALAGGDQPRVNRETPADSLILKKPTSDDDHGGGLRFEPDGPEYRLLSRWIASGAKGVPETRAEFVRLVVSPAEIVFAAAEQTQALQVVAEWSDGTREDVTRLTRFESNNDSVAEVSGEGLVTAKGRGDTHVIAFYDNGIAPVPVMMPVSDTVDEQYPDVPAPTRIDQLVVRKLRKLGVVPSALSSDEEFLRRVSLDLIGTLPTPDEIQQFVADESPDKRRRKIDDLLEHPAYVTWWTTRLCDLTGSNAGYLGGTEMAQPVAAQWRTWLESRVRRNIGWDRIVSGIVTARSRKPGQSFEDFIVEQSRFTAREDPADFGALDNPMPHYWFRDNQNTPADKALTFGFTFLGVRLQCAQCHKHPYDEWSKQDFEQFAEIFARVQDGMAPDAAEPYERMREMLAVPTILNTAALRRQSYLRIAAEGRPIPWKEIFISEPKDRSKPHVAKLLGAESLDLNDYDDPREPLMKWLLRRDNRYFSRAFVNRIWANYFSIGIVDPPDDMNRANPPSNRELLDDLADRFIDNGYDMKWLHRTITNSRTYQLSWRPNETNRFDERNFSRAVPRRLPAEVVIDALLQSTLNDTKLASYTRNVPQRKIGQHPKSYQTRAIDYSLLIFGKPLRTTNCDCERRAAPTLLQSLYVRNDSETLDAMSRKDGWIAQVAAAESSSGGAEPENDEKAMPSIDDLIRSAYLRTLSRSPDEAELVDCREHVQSAESVSDGLQDVLWALLNSKEFITNH